MNPTAQKSRLSQLPAIVATLHLTEEDRQRLHTLILRLHRGRWPLLRCVAIREAGGVLYEAVEWLTNDSPRFGVVTWRGDGLGLSWQPEATRKAALSALRSLR